ncbi:MAG: PQQ-dependent sugar dehydrogenase [Candidatus Limnocylindrales bacterium]
MRPPLALLIALLVAAGACAAPVPSPSPSAPGSASGPTPTASAAPPTGEPSTASPFPTSEVDLQVVVDGLDQPVDVVSTGDGSRDLLVVEQPGVIVRLPGGAGPPIGFLDIRERVAFGGEQGLLGIALDPGFPADGRFYVDYTDTDGNTVVSRFQRRANGTADPGSEHVILRQQQPAPNHNGGAIRFGPDGMLYIAFGDGGGSGSFHGHARDTLLGKILRIDVTGTPPSGATYRVPSDNPFVSVAGVRPEIWLTGLRNPWRFSFDPANGDLWIGDVGAGAREEVDVARAGVGGLDLGWDIMEGTLCLGGGACDQAGLTLPVSEYDHDIGCVIAGGVVYRGAALPDLVGRYLFGDYCSGHIWTIDASAAVTGIQERKHLIGTGGEIVSFGIDATGEVLIVDLRGTIWRLVPNG